MTATRRRTMTVVGGATALLLAGGAYVSVASAGQASARPGPRQTQAAAPHVVQQAQSPTGLVLPRQQPHTVPVQAFADGCDRGYGTATQCFPARAPGDRPVTCDYLRASGWLSTPLPVTNDHLHLVVRGRVCG